MTILSNGHLWKHSEFIENKNFSFNKNKILSSLSKKDIDDAYLSISSWEGYSPTPLIELDKLSKELNLNIIGLMCIPPVNEEPDKYFKEIKILNKKFNLKEISMGMSSDYLKAVENFSTYLRIGSSIFGNRS